MESQWSELVTLVIAAAPLTCIGLIVPDFLWKFPVLWSKFLILCLLNFGHVHFIRTVIVFLTLDDIWLEFEWSTKNGSDPVPDFTSTISADPEPDPIYRGTRAVTGKRSLVHNFFAKYMLQIGYLSYCTMVSKCYLHLFVFSFILFL